MALASCSPRSAVRLATRTSHPFLQKNFHRDPGRAARTEDQSRPVARFLRALRNHPLERVPVRVRRTEARGGAGAGNADEGVDGVLVRVREVRGLLLERDRDGGGDERQAEPVEPGDEVRKLCAERAKGERHVERVLAEGLEIRVVKNG